MKILITGGNGFIAKHLYNFLKNKHTVTAFGSKELNLLDHTAVHDAIKNGNFDIVIHSATYDAAPKHSTKDKSKVLENNLKMFFNIAECKNYFGKLIYFGSGAEFSREHWRPKMKESYFGTHIPTDSYGFSKFIINKFTEQSDNIYNLRLFAVFGNNDDWRTRLISNICCHAVLGRTIPIENNKIYDFLYVSDLVKIVDWFIDNKPKYHVYNICTGQAVEFKKIAEEVVKASGKKLDIEICKNSTHIEYSGDNSRLMAELDGFEFTPMNKAIKELYDWYDTNRQTIVNL